MINFTEFVRQAMPEVERVAQEMADYYGVSKHPKEECFRCELISYYANGRVYETSHHTTWAGEMHDVIDDGRRYKWTMDYNPKTKVFKFEKHFANGMYRIATYTPFDKERLEMTVTE